MAGGVVTWLGTPPSHVQQTDTGYLTWGIPVSHDQINSPDGEAVPPRFLPRILTLLEEYGAICTAAGTVFPIGSCYRSLDYQYQCFYSRRAEHTCGRAIDLLPPPGWTSRKMSVYALARRREHASRLGGIGIAPGWLHLEIAPMVHRAIWRWETNRKAD